VPVTNLRDENDELLTTVKRLNKQHRVLVASLREEVLDNLRKPPPVQTLSKAVSSCSTADYLNARVGLHERLSTHGVPVLDSLSCELGLDLPKRYLEN